MLVVIYMHARTSDRKAFRATLAVLWFIEMIARIGGYLLAGFYTAPTLTLVASTPYLLRFVETYLRLYPDEAGDIVDVLLDLSHGVFVDAEAAALWRAYYEAALRLDMPALPKARPCRWRWRRSSPRTTPA